MDGFEVVEVKGKSFGDYKKFDEITYTKILSQADFLKRKKIVHISATKVGGGVAELLQSQIPLEKELGIDSSWIIIKPKYDFFKFTKKIHNNLQGENYAINASEINLFEKESTRVAEQIMRYFGDALVDLIVVHDPQPLLVGNLLKSAGKKILRLHVDLSNPSSSTYRFIIPLIKNYDDVIVSRSDYLKNLNLKRRFVISPAIDPLTNKNKTVSRGVASKILINHGIDASRPIISQISRFDRWKDPSGVVEAFWIVKEEISDLQLVLVGFIEAVDDPQQKEQLNEVKAAAKGSTDIHIFSDYNQLKGVQNSEFVAAVQTGSDAVIQNSIKEGFGLTVTEAMWKGKAVIGGDAAGIRLQIEDGVNGFISNSTSSLAENINKLILDDKLRIEIGKAAHETVAKKFLITKYLFANFEVYLKTFNIN